VTAPSVRVRELRKSYGSFEAVKGVDFEIHPGEVFGLLGPNGAGKTTTVEILEGLRPRSSGDVTVLGVDPGLESRRLKDQIGVCLQATNLPDKITLREALRLFASLYSHSVDGDALLKRLALWDKRDASYGNLSGGQKQRLALALALINDPRMLFLDEPSAGLDPHARHEIHELVQQLRGEQRTILITTHYIEEAEKLCDRVAIVDEGRIVAMGTPEEIRSRTVGHARVEVRCEQPLPDSARQQLPQWPDADAPVVSADGRTVTVAARRPARTLVELVRWIDQLGIEVEDVQLKRPSLEDVFIELTGKSLRE
jgi:ABC-2 type transport system ATP-binding protein